MQKMSPKKIKPSGKKEIMKSGKISFRQYYSIMNDQLKMNITFWACPQPALILPEVVGLSAISFAHASQKDAAAIPHANKRVLV